MQDEEKGKDGVEDPDDAKAIIAKAGCVSVCLSACVHTYVHTFVCTYVRMYDICVSVSVCGVSTELC